MRRTTIAAAIAAVLTLSLARHARAHAFPRSQTPSAGADLSTAPAQVSITFDAPIEAMFSRLQVLGANNAEEAGGHISLSKDRRTLSVPLKPLSPGNYTVRWAVVAEDGHRTEGSYTFTISAAGSR